jgi:ribosomal protein S18 acetylase RimI-like enzyme
MVIEVKLGEEEEVGIVHKLMLEAFEEYRFLEVPSSAVNESLQEILHKFRNGSEKVALAFVDGVPLGSIRFKVKEDSLYFMRVSVPPQARGKGLAKAMLFWLEKFAKEHQIPKMECRVRLSLPKNIQLYEKIGYEIIKEEAVVNPNGFKVKTVVMEKNVDLLY